MKPMLPLALLGAMLISGCDTVSAPRHSSTSSETQTSLQALADSVQQLHPEKGIATTTVAARTLAIPLDTQRIMAEMLYGSGSDFYQQRNFGIPSDGSMLYLTRAIWKLVEYSDTTVNDSTNQNISSRVGSGSTRAGFAFSYRMVTDSDRMRLNYPVPNDTQFMTGPQPPDMIFRLGEKWEVIVPGPLYVADPSNYLRIYQHDTLIGWMISKSKSKLSPVIDFGDYDVSDLEGNRFDPHMDVTTGQWPFDSLGFFWDKPRADTNGRDLLLPYHWKFFSGTSASLRRSGTTTAPTIRFDASTSGSVGTPLFDQSFSLPFPGDTGSGIARFSNGADIILHTLGWGAFVQNAGGYSDSTASETIQIGSRLDIPSLSP